MLRGIDALAMARARAVNYFEPSGLFAGDSLRFDRSVSDYPASDWALTYRLISASGTEKIEFAATANGDIHEIRIASAVTALWSPGKYSITASLVFGTKRVEIPTSRFRFPLFTIFPNPATETALNAFTAKEQNLMAVESEIQNVITRGTTNYFYGGARAESQSLGRTGKTRVQKHHPGDPPGWLREIARRKLVGGLILARGALRADVRAERNVRGRRIGPVSPKTKNPFNTQGFIKMSFSDPLNPRVVAQGVAFQLPVGHDLPPSPAAKPPAHLPGQPAETPEPI